MRKTFFINVGNDRNKKEIFNSLHVYYLHSIERLYI